MLEGSILKQLADAHQQGTGNTRLNFGVYYKNTLVALCHALEDSILASDCSPVMIAAFQQGKWYLQEAERYGAIANVAKDILIMAAPGAGFREHPTSQQPNVSLVDLDSTDPVAQEWHLIIVSPTYTAMVLCQELSEEDYGVMGRPTSDLERKFYGFWTFEPRLVLETAELAIAKVGQYDSALEHQLAETLHPVATAIRHSEAPCTSPSVEQLGDIVARVVDYLQTHSGDVTDGVSSPLVDQALSSNRLTNNLRSNELQAFLRVAQLLDQADVQNPMAGAEVAALAEAMGQLLDLPGWQLHRLRLAGLLHRLALFQSAEPILKADDSSDHGAADDGTGDDSTTPLSCPLNPGTQVLRTMPRLRAIATIILHQTERWNGHGMPGHLAGDAIPLESRILGLVADFQHHLARINPDTYGSDRFNGRLDPEVLTHALSQCQAEAGEHWDPKLVDVLTLLINGLRQGLNLSVSLPKIAGGLWMLDSHSEEELLNISS